MVIMPQGTQYGILAYLRKHEGQIVTHDDIRQATGYSPPTIWRNLKPLLATGMIEREKCGFGNRRGWGYKYTIHD